MRRMWFSLLVLFLALVSVPWPARAGDNPYEIQLQSGRFTPPAGIPASVAESLADKAVELKARGRQKVHVLVQLYRVPREEEKAELERSGLGLGTYVPRRAWIAAVPVDRLQQMAKRSDIRYLTLWDAERKVQARLKAGKVSPWARDTAQPDRIKVHVELHADVDMARGQQLATEIGASEVTPIEGVHGFEFWMPEKALSRLAEEEDVLWIEEASPAFSPFNDGARTNMRSEIFWGAPYGLDGTGVRLFVLDTASVLSTHESFNPGTGSRVTVIDASAPGNHATHVAGTAAGDGSNSSGGRGRGVATDAPILSGAAANSSLIEPRYQTARNTHNADLGTNSIGFAVAGDPSLPPCTNEGDYTATGNLLDGIVRGTNPNVTGAVLMTWANGNERGAGTPSGRCGGGYNTTPPPSCAKNPIHIGATYSDGSSMTSFSSWGPCDDGRLKPVVSAPGCETGLVTGEAGIYSAVCTATPPGNGTCNQTNLYGTMCGTSMATPGVAGVVAQYIEDWRARGFGGATARPLPALVKAMLVQTSRDLGQDGPDYIYGYGTVDARSLIELSRAGNGVLTGTAKRRWGTGSISQGQTHSYTIQVAAGTGELKATLAWDDAPAPSLSNGALVNNLNLELVEPNGITIHRPWVLNAANPHLAATTGVNNLDNQEQVRVTGPATGTWTVRVVGTTIPQGPQSYGLTFTAEPRPYNSGTCVQTLSGFESGNDSWTLQGGTARVAAPAAGHGSWSLRLGGTVGVQNVAYRNFAIPTWASQAELTYYWYMTTAEAQATGWNFDYLLLEVLDSTGATTLAVPDVRFDGWKSGQWLHQAHVDLSAWRGQTVRVRFRSVNSALRATTFWVDDIQLTTCERPDLWSMDLSTDTGVEPDGPGFMWTSPDIWIRRQIDTSTIHQNPLFGQTNYIKVNVRNRSTVTAPSVTVEAYVANASVGLSWPTQWTLVGTTTLTNVPPTGPPVVAQIPWLPPGIGHYCMLIRLVGDGDPMTFPETTDINYNTRQNNNIVWRNLNIVQFPWQLMGPGAAGTGTGTGSEDDPDDGLVDFILRNIDEQDETVYLQLVDHTVDFDHPFLTRGQITVFLPEELAAIWNETGNEGAGIERIDDLTLRVVAPDAYIALPLSPGKDYSVRMLIEDRGSAGTQPTESARAADDEEKPPPSYRLDVIEHRTKDSMKDPSIDPVGGVSYEIQAAPPVK